MTVNIDVDPYAFEKLTEKDMLVRKAQLDILEYVSSTINTMRESLTRELIVNGVHNEEELKEQLKKIIVEQEENRIDLGVGQ